MVNGQWALSGQGPPELLEQGQAERSSVGAVWTIEDPPIAAHGDGVCAGGGLAVTVLRPEGKKVRW